MRLCVIQAHDGSKRIPCKNINFFCGQLDTFGKILEDHIYGKNKEKRVNDFYNIMVYPNQQKIVLAEFAAFYKTLTFKKII